jgi:hypothetical protein
MARSLEWFRLVNSPVGEGFQSHTSGNQNQNQKVQRRSYCLGSLHL